MKCVCSRRQVAVSEPGTHLSVPRHLAEGQTHGRAAEEPNGAAQTPQRKRTVTGGAGGDPALLSDRGKKQVCNKRLFHLQEIFCFDRTSTPALPNKKPVVFTLYSNSR